MVTSSAATLRENGRRQQRCQHIGGAPPASDASSTTVGVSLLYNKDAVSREHFTTPTTSFRGRKRIQRHDFYCVSNFAHSVMGLLHRNSFANLRPR